MARQPVEIGPTGKRVARNLTKIRARLGLSQGELAQRTSDLGRPLAASALSKIEKLDRRVDVDDLVVLAAALGVSPAVLLLPDEDGPVALAEKLTAEDLRTAWEWVYGEQPFVAGNWPGGVSTWLSWLQLTRPYLDPEEAERYGRGYQKPARLSVEVMQGGDEGDEDDGPGS